MSGWSRFFRGECDVNIPISFVPPARQLECRGLISSLEASGEAVYVDRGSSMGFVKDFDAKNNILRVTIKDHFTDEIMWEIYAALSECAASTPCRGIVDFSEVTAFEVSSGAIRDLAQGEPAFPAGYMRIIVAPDPFIYGMSRMFQILGEKTRTDLHVVRTLDEAYHLLKTETPEFGLLR